MKENRKKIQHHKLYICSISFDQNSMQNENIDLCLFGDQSKSALPDVSPVPDDPFQSPRLTLGLLCPTTESTDYMSINTG